MSTHNNKNEDNGTRTTLILILKTIVLLTQILTLCRLGEPRKHMVVSVAAGRFAKTGGRQQVVLPLQEPRALQTLRNAQGVFIGHPNR